MDYHGIIMEGDFETDNIKAKDSNGVTIKDQNDVTCLVGNDGGTITLKLGTNISEFSIDGTFAGNSDNAVPTEKATKTYVDTELNAVIPTLQSNVSSLQVSASTNESDISTNTSNISTNTSNITDLQNRINCGTNSFAGAGGTTTVTHGLGATPTFANAMPSTDPGGNLGEIWIQDLTSTTFKVGNSGSHTGAFVWMAMKTY